MIASPFNPDIIFSAGYVYITNAYWSEFSLTTDAGLTWYRDTLDSNYRANTACFDPNDGNRLYIAGDSAWSYPYLRLSTDLGQTWQGLGTGLSGSVLTLLPVLHDPNRLYCGTTSGLYKSTDAGASWTRKGTMTNVRAVVLDTASPGVVYCGTGTGVFVSSDGGETWQAFNTGLGMTDVLSLALRSGPSPTLFAGTNGGAVYRTTLSTAVSGPGFAPEDFELTLAPNPCAGRALLETRISRPGLVTISTVAGRRIWTAYLQPGAGSLELPRLPTGVYLVRLDDRAQALTRKLVVQR